MYLYKSRYSNKSFVKCSPLHGILNAAVSWYFEVELLGLIWSKYCVKLIPGKSCDFIRMDAELCCGKQGAAAAGKRWVLVALQRIDLSNLQLIIPPTLDLTFNSLINLNSDVQIDNIPHPPTKSTLRIRTNHVIHYKRSQEFAFELSLSIQYSIQLPPASTLSP